MAVLCEEFGISRKTGYKIYDRYKDCGVQGLTDRSRRPYRQANQLPAAIEQWIVPRFASACGTGVRTDGAPRSAPCMRCWTGTAWSRGAADVGIARRASLFHNRFSRMTCGVGDYKGEFMLADRRYCYPLTVTDFASRYLITCEALVLLDHMRDGPRGQGAALVH